MLEPKRNVISQCLLKEHLDTGLYLEIVAKDDKEWTDLMYAGAVLYRWEGDVKVVVARAVASHFESLINEDRREKWYWLKVKYQARDMSRDGAYDC